MGCGGCSGTDLGQLLRRDGIEAGGVGTEAADELRGADMASLGYGDHGGAMRRHVGERFGVTLAVLGAIYQVLLLSDKTQMIQ